MTRSELDEIIKLVCPHCRAGLVAVRRVDTGEWTHGTMTSHTLCWATGLRNSRFSVEATDG